MSTGLAVDHLDWTAAFSILLDTCLGVQSNDQLLILFDESLGPYLPALTRAIETASLSTTFVFFPKTYQQALLAKVVAEGSLGRVALPTCIVAAVSACTAMVNLVDGDPTNASVRKAINHTPRPKNCRLATIPGISAEILDTLLRSPIESILADCERVAWAVGESRSITVTTHDHAGNRHTLALGWRGWDAEPLMSPGVFLPGSWGNVPPGETFCCPPPSTVSGTICINGSVPGYVIQDGEEVLLEFIDGTLVSWSSPRSSPALTFFDNERARAEKCRDLNWSKFAELGFGMNPIIASLTGNPLFDEKASGTVHIAIGDNSNFGDDVVSLVHHDLVTRNPTVHFDDRLLVDLGVFKSLAVDALRSSLNVTEADIPNYARIHLREAAVHIQDGILKRRLSKAHRVNHVTVSDPATARLLAQLCVELRTYDGVHVTTFLKTYPSFDEMPTQLLLKILYHYRVIRVTLPGDEDVQELHGLAE